MIENPDGHIGSTEEDSFGGGATFRRRCEQDGHYGDGSRAAEEVMGAEWPITNGDPQRTGGHDP